MGRKLPTAGMASRAIRDLREGQVTQSFCRKGLVKLQEQQEYFPRGKEKKLPFVPLR